MHNNWKEVSISFLWFKYLRVKKVEQKKKIVFDFTNNDIPYELKKLLILNGSVRPYETRSSQTFHITYDGADSHITYGGTDIWN